MPRASGYRWVVIGLVFLVTLINIIDRLTISVLGPTIVKSLHLSNFQFGGLATCFLAAYALSQALSGKLYDRVGIKRGFSLSVSVWSVAAMLHGLAGSILALGSLRFVLGLGAAGNWPGAAKVVGEWFPAPERAFAMAIFNSGAALGSVVGIPLIAGLQLAFGWQATFAITGALGFGWLVLWLWLYREPEGGVGAAVPRAPSARADAQPYRILLSDRRTWALILARFFTDPVWWLYITWLPLYLFQVYHFDLKQIGTFGWMPYVAADAGSLAGGWLSGHLIRRGWKAGPARRAVIVGSALMMGTGFIAAYTTSATGALAVISVVLFGFQAWINNVQVLPSDCYEQRNVGSVAGLGGLGAGVGSILFVVSTGWVADHVSYGPILVAAGAIPLIGTFLLLMLTNNLSYD